MAARESQGIQIALIIFVILTVALGVSTYLFFDKFQEVNKMIAGLEKDKLAANESTVVAEKNLRDTVKLISPVPNRKVPELVSEHEKLNAEFYGTGRTVRIRTYPELVEHTRVTIDQLSEELQLLKSQKLVLEKKLQDIELAQKSQIVVYKDKFDESSTRLTTIEDGYSKATSEYTEKTEAALADVERQKRSLVKYEADFQQKIEEREARIREGKKLVTDLEDTLKEYRPEIETIKVASGSITRVNTTDKSAYINLGSQDGLRPRVRFLIIPNNNEQVSQATPKAALEITQVLDAHRSIGRILEGSLTDPVLAGDRIYSETWRKGQRTGFALAGWMDMDGDGRSDRVKIAAIIARNGGRIDAQVHDDGKIEGEMKLNTDYLIIGDYPAEPKGTKATQRGFEQFNKTAEKNNTKSLDFRKYLLKLGYSVTDKEGKQSDFRAREPGKKDGAY